MEILRRQIVDRNPYKKHVNITDVNPEHLLDLDRPIPIWITDIKKYKTTPDKPLDMMLNKAPSFWKPRLPFVPPFNILKQYRTNIFDPDMWSIYDLNTDQFNALHPKPFEEPDYIKQQRDIGRRIAHPQEADDHQLKRTIKEHAFRNILNLSNPHPNDEFNLNKIYKIRTEKERKKRKKLRRDLEQDLPFTDKKQNSDIGQEIDKDKRI